MHVRLDDAMTSEPEVLSVPSQTLKTLYETPEFQYARDNSVRFHVSRNLLFLRRFRGWSQQRLATAIGTSQSHVARIEAGEENIGLDTLERFIVALKGRFFVSTPPEEEASSRPSSWWELQQSTTSTSSSRGWNAVFVAIHDGGDHAVVGLTREGTKPQILALQEVN